MRDSTKIMYKEIVKSCYLIPHYWSKKDVRFCIKYANQFAIELKNNDIDCCDSGIHYFIKDLKNKQYSCIWCKTSYKVS